MKQLTNRQEIAQAMNFGKYPVVKIDLVNADEYGLKGDIVKIDMGKFSDGSQWLERAEIRVYSDERKVKFSAGCTVVSNSKSYRDFMEDVETAQAPVIKPNSQFLLVVYDSRERAVYAVYMVETKGVRRHCATPIECEDVDLGRWVVTANHRYACGMRIKDELDLTR